MKRLVHLQKIEIKNQETEINDCYNYLNYLKNKIHSISLNYKNSFKKNYYSKFNSIAELCDYRLELEKLQFQLNIEIKKIKKTINKLKKTHVIQINNLLYHELLINKIK